jgi:hypothetical protein
VQPTKTREPDDSRECILGDSSAKTPRRSNDVRADKMIECRVHKSVVGTFETCQLALKMSVYRGWPTVKMTRLTQTGSRHANDN